MFEFFRFELRQQLRSPVLWLLGALFAAMAFGAAATDAIQIGGSVGNVHRNAPMVVVQFLGIFTLIGMLFTAMAINGALLRDFEQGTAELIFASPIQRRDYVAGRILAAVIACLLVYAFLRFTTWGFAMEVIGGNAKTARMMGLNVGRYVLLACGVGGAAAGIAGTVEVAAVLGKANASLAVGYGYAGILVSFLARHHPLAIIPVAILLGGIGASGGLLQRRLDLPDAAVVVLQGIIFVAILASETLYGRLLPRRQES